MTALEPSRYLQHDQSLIEVELSGLSGARVILMRQGDKHSFVRKISSSVSGNARLQQQAVKQRLLASMLGRDTRTPDILDEGFDQQSLYYFDMEYIQGLDGVSYLRTASLPDVSRFATKLRDCLELFASHEEKSLSFSPKANILSKCSDILNSCAKDDPLVGSTLERLIGCVAAFNMPSELYFSTCHGDMTLENIVVLPSGQIVFIDLLETFFTHWIADIAKLEQDLTAGWYMRKSSELPAGVVYHVRKALRDFAQSRFEIGPQMISLLVCVHLARILPYVRNDVERDFVLERLNFFTNSI